MEATDKKRVIIVGGGFAGINCAKALGHHPELEVVLVDRRNYHLFQPLLYQVAMAGLSPAEIARPIRSLLSDYPRVSVLQGEVKDIAVATRTLHGDFGEINY